MAVSLPTAADVQKFREQAAKTVTEQAETVKTPALAVLGAGEYAYSTILGAYQTARERATERAEKAQKFAAELPGEISELRGKLSTEELRKLVDQIREQAEKAYADLAGHGESTWTEIRKQPQVKQAFSQVEDITGKVDARVDALVDDAHDAAAKALATFSRESRSVGEKVAVRTQKAAGEAAEVISEVASDVSKAVSDTGKDTAKAVSEAGRSAAAAVDEAGDEVAATTRSTTRKAANRATPVKPASSAAKTTTTAKATPAKTAPKAATRKPATRRTGGTTSES